MEPHEKEFLQKVDKERITMKEIENFIVNNNVERLKKILADTKLNINTISIQGTLAPEFVTSLPENEEMKNYIKSITCRTIGQEYAEYFKKINKGIPIDKVKIGFKEVAPDGRPLDPNILDRKETDCLPPIEERIYRPGPKATPKVIKEPTSANTIVSTDFWNSETPAISNITFDPTQLKPKRAVAIVTTPTAQPIKAQIIFPNIEQSKLTTVYQTIKTLLKGYTGSVEQFISEVLNENLSDFDYSLNIDKFKQFLPYSKDEKGNNTKVDDASINVIKELGVPDDEILQFVYYLCRTENVVQKIEIIEYKQRFDAELSKITNNLIMIKKSIDVLMAINNPFDYMLKVIQGIMSKANKVEIKFDILTTNTLLTVKPQYADNQLMFYIIQQFNSDNFNFEKLITLNNDIKIVELSAVKTNLQSLIPYAEILGAGYARNIELINNLFTVVDDNYNRLLAKYGLANINTPCTAPVTDPCKSPCATVIIDTNVFFKSIKDSLETFIKYKSEYDRQQKKLAKLTTS